MEGRGWLGWLRARYEVSSDRVLLRRSWWPALLLLGGPLCAFLLYDVFSSLGPEPVHDATGIVVKTLVGALGFVAFIGGLFSIPCSKPRKLVVTSAGIACDDDWFDLPVVTGVTINSIMRRGKTTTYDIAVELHLTTRMPVRFPLYTSGVSQPPAVAQFVAACNAVIHHARQRHA